MACSSSPEAVRSRLLIWFANSRVQAFTREAVEDDYLLVSGF
jgi:hypothetical protein